MYKFLFILTLLPVHLVSQENFSVFLLGDAGNDTVANPLLIGLKEELTKNTNSAVVFLGDNIYPKGFLKKSGPKHEIEKKKMLSQLLLLKEYSGSAFFVPGNHDWRIGKLNGKKSVQQECNFVNNWCSEETRLKNKDTGVFCPQNGAPGPVSFILAKGLRLVMIDTQWWLQPWESNKYERNNFLMQLDSILGIAHANNEKVLIAAHHPVFSNGRHGKSRQPLRFLLTYTPLQIFGLLGLNRLLVQDIEQPKYRKLRQSLLTIFEKYPGIIYAAGHEHNLQFKPPSGEEETPINNIYESGKKSDDFFIVSGSGSKVTSLTEKKYKPLFSYDKGLGFFRLDFLENGKIIISAFTITNNKIEKLFSRIY